MDQTGADTLLCGKAEGGHMKRCVAVILMAVLISCIAWTADQAQSRGAVSGQAGGTLVAPAGAELEFLLGSVGLIAEMRLMVLPLGGDWSLTLEPGVNFRYYVNATASSLFYFAGVNFLSLWRLSPFSPDQGIVKARSGLGYNWLLGTDSRWRLGLEIGAAWLQEVIEDDLYDLKFPLVPHLLVFAGRRF
jgi:hypothetical protein